jgi:hypothetical protein
VGWVIKDLVSYSRQGKRVSLLCSVETSSSTYPVTYPIGTVIFNLWDKSAGE